MDIKNEAVEVCRLFNIEGKPVGFKVFTEGHINTTYFLEFKKDDKTFKYLVQGINTHVFKNPHNLMENIVNVTEFLRNKIIENGGDSERETLRFLKCKEDKYYLYFNEKCWRVYNYIDNAYTLSKIENLDVFESAGRSFGLFQKNLDEYPMDTLHETIKDFHNTPRRVATLEASVKADCKNRASQVEKDIAFALDRKQEAEKLIKLHNEGRIPLRVTHNDTKINNILFDSESDEAICVIDLDTIMPGFSLYDFGDAIRFGANTTREDDDNLDNVKFSVDHFKAFAKGFLSACAKELTVDEVDNLAFASKLMTYECGVRFITDYLDGDVYFKTAYQGHNLVRARNQFKLVYEMEQNMDKMNEIIKELYAQYT